MSTFVTVQSPGGLSGPISATQGGTITVAVESGDGAIVVSTGGPGGTVYPVPAGGSVTVPVPSVPIGTLITISVGKGNRKAIIEVLVVGTGP
jgi:hypothetical protein